jgi:hypothetical protein
LDTGRRWRRPAKRRKSPNERCRPRCFRRHLAASGRDLEHHLRIGALDDANFYANDTRYILTNLNALGWVLIIVGIIQLTGGFSLMAGNVYGRVIGVIAGSLGATAALFSMGDSHPFWSLAIFALCVWIVYGLIVYGSDEASDVGTSPRA